MDPITNTGKLTQNELRCINSYQIWEGVYSLACITTGNVISLITEYLEATTNSLTSYLEWPVTRMEGQDKAPRKEAMGTITSQDGTLII